MRRSTIFVFVMTILLSIQAQTIDSEKINELVERVRNKLNLKTGLTIGVVVGTKTEYVNAFGSSNLEQKIKATPDSPFYIASSTKSFTAALVEVLSEKDSLNIDVPVSTYLPEYEFESENLKSNLISIRDLLTHRSGILSLPAVIRTAYTGQHTNKKLFDIYKSARFTTPEFKYGNDGYVFTSLILDKLYTKPWQQLMSEELFLPLEMKSTSCKVSDYNADNLKAYTTDNGTIKNIQFLKADNTMHAAGGIITTATDLCNWLSFNLNNGMFNGKRILSKYKMDEIHSPQISCDVNFWEYKRFAYGLGWYLSEYNDELLVHHFGGYAGARSHISFMPEHNIGVAALTNDDGDGFFVVDLVADYIYNLYLGKDADAIAENELSIILSNRESNQPKKDDQEKIHVTSNYDYYDLLGKYEDDAFGSIEILGGEQMQLKYGNLTGDLKPSTETQFRVLLGSFNTKIEFTEENGRISQLIFYGPTKIVFNKVKS